MITMMEVVNGGGCYWSRDRDDSPGHAIALPNGTPFKIATSGALSHEYVEGKCEDGYFHVLTGKKTGTKFESASAAVNAVREPQTNAFLYIHFRIGSDWILADDMRRMPQSREDVVFEAAMRTHQDYLHATKKGKDLDQVQIAKLAAELMARKPEFLRIHEEDLQKRGILASRELNNHK